VLERLHIDIVYVNEYMVLNSSLLGKTADVKENEFLYFDAVLYSNMSLLTYTTAPFWPLHYCGNGLTKHVLCNNRDRQASKV